MPTRARYTLMSWTQKARSAVLADATALGAKDDIESVGSFAHAAIRTPLRRRPPRFAIAWRSVILANYIRYSANVVMKEAAESCFFVYSEPWQTGGHAPERIL